MIGPDAIPVTDAERSVLLHVVASEWRREERRITIEARGVSMAPLIRPGDRLSLQLAPPHALRAGDVFAFQHKGAIVVHRLIAKRRAGAAWQFCEKGDGLTGWNWVEECAILGRVEEILRAGRRLDLRRLPWRVAAPAGAMAWSVWVAAHERLRGMKLRRYGARPLPRVAAAPARGIVTGVHLAYRLTLRILQAGRWR